MVETIDLKNTTLVNQIHSRRRPPVNHTANVIEQNNKNRLFESRKICCLRNINSSGMTETALSSMIGKHAIMQIQ